jgi:hypothetical protein
MTKFWNPTGTLHGVSPTRQTFVVKALIALSNRSGSRRCTSRRTADSDGAAAVIPSATATSAGRSAAHSAIATNERAPAAPAHTATDNTVTSP